MTRHDPLNLLHALLDAITQASTHLRSHCVHRRLQEGCEGCDLRRLSLSVCDEWEDVREALYLVLSNLDHANRMAGKYLRKLDDCKWWDDLANAREWEDMAYEGWCEAGFPLRAG